MRYPSQPAHHSIPNMMRPPEPQKSWSMWKAGWLAATAYSHIFAHILHHFLADRRSSGASVNPTAMAASSPMARRTAA